MPAGIDNVIGGPVTLRTLVRNFVQDGSVDAEEAAALIAFAQDDEQVTADEAETFIDLFDAGATLGYSIDAEGSNALRGFALETDAIASRLEVIPGQLAVRIREGQLDDARTLIGAVGAELVEATELTHLGGYIAVVNTPIGIEHEIEDALERVGEVVAWAQPNPIVHAAT
jgi:hypothetical protein